MVWGVQVQCGKKGKSRWLGKKEQERPGKNSLCVRWVDRMPWRSWGSPEGSGQRQTLQQGIQRLALACPEGHHAGYGSRKDKSTVTLLGFCSGQLDKTDGGPFMALPFLQRGSPVLLASVRFNSCCP